MLPALELLHRDEARVVVDFQAVAVAPVVALFYELPGIEWLWTKGC